MRSRRMLERLEGYLQEVSDNLCYYRKELPDVDLSNLEEELKKSKVFVSAVIKSSDEESKNRLDEFIVPGNIIMVSGTDGISFDTKTYYKITSVDNNHIVVETLNVTVGDHYNKIGYENLVTLDKKEFHDHLRYHESEYSIKVSGNEEDWDKYYKFCKTIHF